jgi:hypothetical protein
MIGGPGTSQHGRLSEGLSKRSSVAILHLKESRLSYGDALC